MRALPLAFVVSYRGTTTYYEFPGTCIFDSDTFGFPAATCVLLDRRQHVRRSLVVEDLVGPGISTGSPPQ